MQNLVILGVTPIQFGDHNSWECRTSENPGSSQSMVRYRIDFAVALALIGLFKRPSREPQCRLAREVDRAGPVRSGQWTTASGTAPTVTGSNATGNIEQFRSDLSVSKRCSLEKALDILVSEVRE